MKKRERKSFILNDSDADILAKIVLNQIKNVSEEEQKLLDDVAADLDLDIEEEDEIPRRLAMKIISIIFDTQDPQNTARGILSKSSNKAVKDVKTSREQNRLNLMTNPLARATRKPYAKLNGGFDVQEDAKLGDYDIRISESRFREFTSFLLETNSHRCFVELERPSLNIRAYARIFGDVNDENENLIFISPFLMNYFKNPRSLQLYGMCDMQEMTRCTFLLYDGEANDALKLDIERLTKDMPAISVGQEFTLDSGATIQVKEIWIKGEISVSTASVPLVEDNLNYNVEKMNSQIACNYCEKMTAIGQCCRKVHYCGEGCQKKDWNNHIKECMRIQF